MDIPSFRRCRSSSTTANFPASSRSLGTLKPSLAKEPCCTSPRVSIVTCALAAVKLDCGVENLLDLLPVLGCHDRMALLCNVYHGRLDSRAYLYNAKATD